MFLLGTVALFELDQPHPNPGDIHAKVGLLPVLDTSIGATAIVHRLTVVTRNTPDIRRTGAAVHDPWI